jgi:Tfp pilus assembly protein PilN
MRGGPLAYVVVATLAAALIGVTVLVVTENQISDRKAEIVELESATARVQARSQALAAYQQFHSVREQRLATITSLADSRFDWERVMRELALVLPRDVWLTTLTASANPAATTGGGGVSLRSSISGPALELVGCARSHDAVAGLVQALKDIDGVTRVGLPTSTVGASGGSESCQTRDFIAQFQMVAAFDAAPAPVEGGATEVAPAPTETATPTAEAEG